MRAEALSIPSTVIHNASVMNAVGAVGLALYNFGQTVSIPFFTETWRPDSWLERVRENAGLGLHTLCLLDIKVKEQSEENLARCVASLGYNSQGLELTGCRDLAGAARSLSLPGSCRSRPPSSSCSPSCPPPPPRPNLNHPPHLPHHLHQPQIGRAHV